jgi:hypothetical protein
MEKSPNQKGGVTARAVVAALLFIPINAYLVVQWETVWGTQYPTTMSIFFNVVFCLFLITAVNALFRRVAPRQAFQPAELLTFYAVLAVAVCVSGHDFSQGLFCTLGVAHRYATPENEWQTLFGRHLSKWLTVNDDRVLNGFFDGSSTILDPVHLRGWVVPAFWWTTFLTVVVFVMFCLNALVRRQWIEHEKLAYPLVELPYEFAQEEASRFFRNRLLWLGCGLAAGVDLLNGVHVYLPSVPAIPMRYDMGAHLTERPWNSMNGLMIYTTPYAVGLAFPIPLELLSSLALFFAVWKLERMFGAVAGLKLPGYPFEDQQLLGGYLAIVVFVVWQERRSLLDMTRRVVSRQNTSDRDEPMRYRTAVLGAVGGFAFLVLFLSRAGMAIWFAVAFFVVYFGISLAYTRMRAEIGPPLQGIHYSGPLQLIVAVVGSRRISAPTFTVAAPLWPFTKELRNNPMPVQLENLKLAARGYVDTRRLWKAMMLGAWVGLLATFWAFLDVNYRYGGPGSWRGVTAYSVVERWLVQPSGADATFLTATGVGFLVVAANIWLRLRFLWWPLHPLGYLLTGYYHWERLWFPFFVGWIAKRIILRTGGIRGYRRALPFFLGLVLGEFVMGSVWGGIGLLTNTRSYAFRDW